VKNGMPMLDQTLKSVCNQNYSNFNVVIPLGKSSDDSELMIAKYQEKFKITVISDCDNGIFAAMNKSLDFCQGSYVCFLGAGDVFTSENVLTYVSRNLSKTNDWTIAPWVFFNQGSQVIANPTPQNFGIKDICRTSTPICHQTVFMHVDFINSLRRFNLEYVVASDRDLIVRAWLKSQPVKLTAPIAGYLDGGFSAKNQEIGHRELKRIQGSVLKRFILELINRKTSHKRAEIHEVHLKPFEWLSIEIKESISEYSVES
jgi:glycosyltransferase involved in cell wall biosynthesis